MSIRYNNASGQEIIISGLTPGGDIEAGAVDTRTGICTKTLTPNSGAIEDVTFSTPLPDDDYIVDVWQDSTTPYSHIVINIGNKTANGFRIRFTNVYSDPLTVNFKWTATKTYTVQHAAQNAEDIAEIKQAMPSGAGSGNKLVTTSQLTNTTSPIVNAVADLQDLVPVGASINNQLVTQSEASVDSALSSSSEHAVQNKVVKAAIDTKQDTLTFDNVPTAESTNPVKSGGIYNLFKIVDENGVVNLLDISKHNKIQNGITATDNADGSITLSADSAYSGSTGNWFYLGEADLKANHTYILSGSPMVSPDDGTLGGLINKWSNWQFGTAAATVPYGDGEPYTPTTDIHLYFGFRLVNGTNYNGLTYKPMLRYVEITDNTFIPFAKTNKELTTDIVGLQQNLNKNGVKNLLPTRGAGTTATSYGVTFTIQEDGSVIANGTANGGQAIFQVNYKVPLKQGETYILSGGLSTSKFAYVNAINNNSYVKTIGLSVGDHNNQYDLNPFTPDYDGYTHLEIGVAVNNGVTCTNDRFYPMVRLASDPDETFEPYTMTNKELTEHYTTVAKTFAQSSADVATYLRNANTSSYIALGYSYNRIMITVNAIFTIKASGNALYKSDGTTATSGNENWELIKIPNFPYSKAIPDGPLSGLLFLNTTDLKDLYCRKSGNDLIFTISATDYASFAGKGIRLSATIMLK